jgi:hypothetical protein
MLANFLKNIFKICLSLHNSTSKFLRSLRGSEGQIQIPNLKSLNNYDCLNLLFVFTENLINDDDLNLSIHFRFWQFIFFMSWLIITKIYFANDLFTKNLSKITFIKFQHFTSR